MFTISANNADGAVGLGPYEAQEALRRAIDLRDQGFRNIKLTDTRSGITVDAEQFMRNPPTS